MRLLLESNYKPQLIRPAWFWRFDRLYESKGVKAVYLRTMGLEIDSMQLVALIRRMKEADVPGRIELLRNSVRRTRNPVYFFSRFSGTPNRPPPTCVTLLFNACGLNTQNPANV
ncbi:MAG: hypothetical protein ACLRMJ_05965 [Alistipes finegoldii]